jgi:hypothetical protein
VVSGEWRWRVGLPACRAFAHSRAPNDDDSVVVVVFSVIYSKGVWGRRAGVLGVAVVAAAAAARSCASALCSSGGETKETRRQR